MNNFLKNNEKLNIGKKYSPTFNEGCRFLFDAQDEFDKKNAFMCFLRGHEDGDLDCTYYLGMCYEYGFGCDVDLELAVLTYGIAASQDYADAINNLGGCYLYGHGTEKDPYAAFECFNRAYELGSAKACCRLGICYHYGYGTEKDGDLAIYYYKKAAESELDIACILLADCYERGVFVEKNVSEAFNYYKLAAELGNNSSMLTVGDMLTEGRGVKRDVHEGFNFYTLASKHGNFEAKLKMAECYTEGVGTVKNYREAFKIYKALLNNEDYRDVALYKMGIAYTKGRGVDVDKEQAFKYFKESADLGYTDAIFSLGECYFYGIGCEKDYDLAFKCYENAADKCSGWAYNALGECYEGGLGTSKDYVTAAKCYKKAADFENIEGLYNIGRCIMEGVGADAGFHNPHMFITRAAKRSHTSATYIYGVLFDNQGSVSEAVNWYMKTILLDVNQVFPEYVSLERKNSILKRDHLSKTKAKYKLGKLKLKINRSPRNCIESLNYIANSASIGYYPAEVQIFKLLKLYGDIKLPSGYEFDESTDGITSSDIAFAMNKLGNCYFSGETGTFKKDETAAARCFKISAELGNSNAAYSYGWCLRHGRGVVENNVEAAKWLKMSADKGNANAAYSYGLCCEEGCVTGTKNRREALMYYKKAANAGHVDAGKRYIEIFEKEVKH